MILTGRQIREGRILAGLSQDDLATAAEVALALVIRAETTDWLPMIKVRDSTALKYALEGAGVIFIAENGEGPGVRLRKVAQ